MAVSQPILYQLHTKELEEEAVFQQHLLSLSPQRQEKVKRFRFRRDQLLSLGAGVLLDRGLQAHGLRERDVEIAYGPQGKPYLPLYPDIHWNLSHSGHLVIAAFAPVEVGCDVETFAPIDLKLAHRFFCPCEVDFILSHPLPQQEQAFYRLWTLKESFMKVTGLGFSLPLSSFSIVPHPPHYLLHQTVSPLSYTFQEFPSPTHTIALCVRS